MELDDKKKIDFKFIPMLTPLVHIYPRKKEDNEDGKNADMGMKIAMTVVDDWEEKK